MKNSFNDLRKYISENGSNKIQCRDLELQIEHITERNLNLNVERVKKDLDDIKKENEKLRSMFKILKEKSLE
jgi:predicted mannosyl-3-phosphoglycerate phosphatase (HAD superfamily)